MTTPRLFVASPLTAGAEFVLSAPQAHYLLRVLRLSEGAGLLVFDGKSGEWRAEITGAKKSWCRVRCTTKVRGQTDAQDIHYAFAPLKQARLDYMVQKATEMGVSALQPVMTARTAISRLNPGRMRANVIEAAEQCGILTVPSVNPPVKLETLLEVCEADRVIVFCDECEPKAPALDAIAQLQGRKITALVGPEGGFSPDERQMLLSQHFVYPVSLGPRIMRADTAAVAVLALVNAVLGDWR